MRQYLQNRHSTIPKISSTDALERFHRTFAPLGFLIVKNFKGFNEIMNVVTDGGKGMS